MLRAFCIAVLLSMACDKGFLPEESSLPLRKDLASSISYVYMSPAGNNSGDGTIGSPLATLDGVQSYLKTARPDGDVVVRIRSDQGVYFDQTVIWDYHNSLDDVSDEYNISFEPYPDSLYACFLGVNADTTFFTLDRRDGKPSNVHFRKLSIRAYVHGAIWFCGNRAYRYGWNGYNSIDDCIFYEIGNLSQPWRNGCYGVLDFMNSSYNVVRNCMFFSCANFSNPPFPQTEEEIEAANDQALNGIYLAHHSSNNYVVGNIFQSIKGDAIRIRDSSDENEICYNEFYKTGWTAVCTMWYCNPLFTTCLPTPDGIIDECPSYWNTFHDNWAEGNWMCGSARLFEDMRPEEKKGCVVIVPPLSSLSAPTGDLVRMTLFDNTTSKCDSTARNSKNIAVED